MASVVGLLIYINIVLLIYEPDPVFRLSPAGNDLLAVLGLFSGISFAVAGGMLVNDWLLMNYTRLGKHQDFDD